LPNTGSIEVASRLVPFGALSRDGTCTVRAKENSGCVANVPLCWVNRQAYGLVMCKGRRFLARLVLLSVAFLMAVQPIALAYSQTQQQAKVATDWDPIVICTAHGAVTLTDDGGLPRPPSQKAPDCPYCTLGCNAGLAKVLLPRSAAEPRPPLRFTVAIRDPVLFDAPRQLMRLLTSPARAPPSQA
jgi:Protein of unknown function (DUF2946)